MSAAVIDVPHLPVWRLCLEHVGCDRIDPLVLAMAALSLAKPKVQRRFFDDAYRGACDLLQVDAHAPVIRPFDTDVDERNPALIDARHWVGEAYDFFCVNVIPIMLKDEALEDADDDESQPARGYCQ